MRKFMVIPLGGLLAMAMAGPALAGPNVSNTSGSLTVAQGSFDSYDEESGAYRSGYLSVSRDAESSQAFAELSLYEDAYVQCTGADTPDDPNDDSFGYRTTMTWAWGDSSLVIGKNNGTAEAAADLFGGRETFDGCTGEWSFEELELAVSMSLTATSGTVRETGRGSFHLPGEYNGHSSYKSVYRSADGDLVIDGVTHTAFGVIGKVSWSDHFNG
jgi:hypothetical protein